MLPCFEGDDTSSSQQPWNYEQNKKIAPFKPRERDPDGNHRFMQRDADRIQEFRKCIEC